MSLLLLVSLLCSVALAVALRRLLDTARESEGGRPARARLRVRVVSDSIQLVRSRLGAKADSKKDGR